MYTAPITTGQTGSQLPKTSASSNPYNLKPEDFIKLMVTQLQNQDPTQPASNSELLSQMSNIGQLESSTDLQSTLKSVSLQSSVGSASSLIGKTVTGINVANKSTTGVVDSVSVSGTDVSLNLDTGDHLSISNVSSIAPTAAATTPGGAATPKTPSS